MASQIILRRTPTSVNRRQPLLLNDGCGSKSADFGEFCGGTTAECAAICCCCPCGLANLLVLAIYKVPAGLCRRAIRQSRRRRLLKKGLLRPRGGGGFGDNDMQVHPVICLEDFFPPDVEVSEEAEKAAVELEKEMWERFYGTGFWRSPSQREGETTSPRLKQL